ncbi:MAG: VOC family protein [Actinomycetota bacterium]|nr:VOC family protein [Actinomycetota bacterium]
MARLIGMNHVALEVRDLDEALDFLGRVFEFELRGRVPGMAFVDMGDQFLALAERRSAAPGDEAHFGLVVDDVEDARRGLERAGAEILPSRGLRFRDPSRNVVEVVSYTDVQFTKDRQVLRGMGLDLEKSEGAQRELEGKRLL